MQIQYFMLNLHGWFSKATTAHKMGYKMHPYLSKGLYAACNDAKPIRKHVVYFAADTFQMFDGGRAISVAGLMIEFLKLQQAWC